ncbi:ATP/GTP-binding protein [Aliivibrio sp. 1S128]|uniref:AAA family ATPase n=1 Tax=Aliivibrio sp. 1S128 TaxID=1840085 RepID=UPI00080E9EDB|nr:ATP-binding protein [Aliivibrio sp. 1S128]OCH11037.1 chromosome segregation protein SMC [Aliivibrio sp. 1S128]
MISRFSVTGFKNFKDTITLDFTNTKGYNFNDQYIVNGIVNKGLIYGRNGVGKSNFGFALFDIVKHVTDKNIDSDNYHNYLNADSDSNIAEFSYELSFECGTIQYNYGKSDLETLVYEEIIINGNRFAFIDRRVSTIAEINAKGAENLEKDIGNSNLSIISYINKNTLLTENNDNSCFSKFIKFINGMLFFRSLDGNSYIGFEQGSSGILEDIAKRGNTKDLEKFLNTAGVDCQLSEIERDGSNSIGFKFKNKTVPFYSIASQGTKSLALFYFWLQRFRNSQEISFIFIDEYDAFYHHELSELVIENLLGSSAQALVTTHNTSIISNDLLRPDCYFMLTKIDFKSLSHRTRKDLREAHNIEKMFKAGAFNG